MASFDEEAWEAGASDIGNLLLCDLLLCIATRTPGLLMRGHLICVYLRLVCVDDAFTLDAAHSLICASTPCLFDAMHPRFDQHTRMCSSSCVDSHQHSEFAPSAITKTKLPQPATLADSRGKMRNLVDMQKELGPVKHANRIINLTVTWGRSLDLVGHKTRRRKFLGGSNSYQ